MATECGPRRSWKAKVKKNLGCHNHILISIHLATPNIEWVTAMFVRRSPGNPITFTIDLHSWKFLSPGIFLGHIWSRNMIARFTLFPDILAVELVPGVNLSWIWIERTIFEGCCVSNCVVHSNWNRNLRVPGICPLRFNLCRYLLYQYLFPPCTIKKNLTELWQFQNVFFYLVTALTSLTPLILR